MILIVCNGSLTTPPTLLANPLPPLSSTPFKQKRKARERDQKHCRAGGSQRKQRQKQSSAPKANAKKKQIHLQAGLLQTGLLSPRPSVCAEYRCVRVAYLCVSNWLPPVPATWHWSAYVSAFFPGCFIHSFIRSLFHNYTGICISRQNSHRYCQCQCVWRLTPRVVWQRSISLLSQKLYENYTNSTHKIFSA